MRENIKSIGLILALAIAGVSLPIGIIGFNKEPIINNYYDNYYTTNNNTTIINNNTTIITNNNTYTPEPEPELISYPLAKDVFLIWLNGSTYGTFNYTYNATMDFNFFIWISRNDTIFTVSWTFYDLELINAGFDYYATQVYTVGGQSEYHNYDYHFAYSTTWLIVFEFFDVVYDKTVNMTIIHQVREIR